MKTEAELAALRAEFDGLNAAVDAATKARHDWLNAHMADFARYPIGERMVHSDGRYAGTIEKYFRNGDNTTHVHYQIREPSAYGGISLINTSSTYGLISEREYEDRLLSKAKLIELQRQGAL